MRRILRPAFSQTLNLCFCEKTCRMDEYLFDTKKLHFEHGIEEALPFRVSG